MHFGKVVRAARNYLNISQTDFAEAISMTGAGIVNLEKRENIPPQNTYKKIINYFMLRGIVFTDGAIHFKSNSIVTIDGDDWWLECLNDVHETLNDAEDKEVLFLFSDDRLSPTNVNDKLREMRKDGIKMRQIIVDGNTFMMGYEDEYKMMPKKYFAPRVALVYADKYIVCAEDNTKAVIFKDNGLADQIRNMFEFIWAHLPVVAQRSTADERF